MNPLNEIIAQQTRRTFLERGTLGLGTMALGALLDAAPAPSRRKARHRSRSVRAERQYICPIHILTEYFTVRAPRRK